MTRKADNLAVLAGHGIAVPRGFLLDGSHFTEALAAVGTQIGDALRDGEPLMEAFAESARPTARTKRAIDVGLAALDGAHRFAVRSSGTVVARGVRVDEDGTETSLAGQFESYLAVPAERVSEAVTRCWASLYNPRSVASFAADADYIEKSTMSVVIQEMIPAAASAVMMTMDPLGDGTTGGIEMTVGPCEAIVSGVASPDEVIFRRFDREIVSFAIGRKEHQVVYSDFDDGPSNSRLVPVDQDIRDELSVDRPVLDALIALCQRIELIFDRPQDIECVTTTAGDIVVTQTRAVTRLPASWHGAAAGTP